MIYSKKEKLTIIVMILTGVFSLLFNVFYTGTDNLYDDYLRALSLLPFFMVVFYYLSKRNVFIKLRTNKDA